MRFKLLGATLSVAVLAPALAGWHAEAQERGKSKPAVSIAIPEIKIEPPSIVVKVPMPELAPVAVIPDINIDIPELKIAPEIWSYDDGDDEGERTEREELRQTYQLSPGARVELSDINGSIDIETNDGNAAELHITSYSYEPNPRKLAVEQTASALAVRGVARTTRDGFNDTIYRVALKLPRRVNLTLNGTNATVRVGELDGSIRLANISGSVGVAQAAGSAELSQVSGSVTLKMARVGAGGVRVDNVSGKVSVRFMDDVNADLQTTGIKGKVYVELPNVAVQGEMSRSDFRAKIGAGGAPINVSDVTGSVRLARGASVPEMLNILKTADRNTARMETARDLSLHISNRQVRQAMIDALNGDQNYAVQVTAVRALVPYVSEPEVREAFMKVIETGKNEAIRTTAVRAVAKNYAADKAVRDTLLRVLAAEQKDIVRVTIIGAVGKYADDPNVQRALVEALKNDRSDIVRMRSASALAKRADNQEVYELLLNAARNDKKMIVRANAMNGLTRRIKERPELRELFVGYLDHESSALQYQALRGLVELGDPSLKTRLVEKAKEMI
ncbi:MAG TPA: HEAT repeat domain-containing protein, partial [Pyrinomonadaceae bacterium]|nr:HEAT repeat domain-containing protein [Pyrinomonadaceae bacterium]